jgi:tetratricopeptide (TPR) repeat protein
VSRSFAWTDRRRGPRVVVWRRAAARGAAGIGGACQHLGRLDAAQRLLATALTVLGPVPATDQLRLATLTRLGVVLKTAGRYRDADVRYTEVLSALTSMSPPPHDLLAVTRHNLAGLRYARGDYQQAENEIRAALIHRQEAHAAAAERAADEGVLGAVLAAQGREAEARNLLNQVLIDMEHAHGPDHYEVAVVLQNLAALDHHQDPARAQQRYERALQIKRQQLGARHPEAGILLNNLATLHLQQGRHHLALALCTRARHLLARRYGPNHPASRTCEQNLQRIRTQLAAQHAQRAFRPDNPPIAAP